VYRLKDSFQLELIYYCFYSTPARHNSWWRKCADRKHQQRRRRL